MILQSIARHLQEFYRLDDLPAIDQFLIDADTAAALLGRSDPQRLPSDELLLVKHDTDDLEVALYIAPAILDRLRDDDPFTALHAGNMAPFCVAVEGISHLCCVLWKFLNGLPVSELELEMQGEIDKFLCCAWLQRMQDTPRLPIHHRLFTEYRLAEGISTMQSARYHLASQIADRFCRLLTTRYFFSQRMQAMHRSLKAFYRLSGWEKRRQLGGY